jgi:hypothetical protein
MRLTLLAALMLCASIAAAADQAITSLALEEDGGAVSVLWKNDGPFHAGLSHYRFGDTYWTFATAGVTSRRGRTILQAEANFGPGRSTGDFLYKIARVSITRQISSRRVFLELEDRYIDVDTQEGNLVRGGVSWVPRNDLLLSASQHVSTGGDLGARFTSARADWERDGIRWSGGAAAGVSDPVLFQQIDFRSRVSITEFFAGVSAPTSRGRLGFILQSIRTGGDNRLRGTVLWTLPE